jgi:hypothetical protein
MIPARIHLTGNMHRDERVEVPEKRHSDAIVQRRCDEVGLGAFCIAGKIRPPQRRGQHESQHGRGDHARVERESAHSNANSYNRLAEGHDE